MSIIGVEFPGAPDYDFWLGKENRKYGMVQDIVRARIDDNTVLITVKCAKLDIVINEANPLMLVYWSKN